MRPYGRKRSGEGRSSSCVCGKDNIASQVTNRGKCGKIFRYENFCSPRSPLWKTIFNRISPTTSCALSVPSAWPTWGTPCIEVLVRTWLCAEGKATGRGLHQATMALVRAESQAEKAERILPLLTEEEAGLCSAAGRNAQREVGTRPMPAGPSIGEATALEALLGWLYLKGRRDRINALFRAMMEGSKTMPLDGICMQAVAEELRPELLGLRIDKVQQPARDQVILLLRGERAAAAERRSQPLPGIQLTEPLTRDNPGGAPHVLYAAAQASGWGTGGCGHPAAPGAAGTAGAGRY